MPSLIVGDDRELRRLEQAIAAIEQRRGCSTLGTDCLLTALKAERDELMRLAGRSARATRGGLAPHARLSA